MNLVVSTEHRFDCTPDGQIWTSSAFAYPFWTRYLDVFEQVCILARVRRVEQVPATFLKANGPGVDFFALPYYIGPYQFLRVWRTLNQKLSQAISPNDAVILRVPSAIAMLAEPVLERTGHPFGVEVVGDPYDVFAPGAVRHPLRPFFRWWFMRALKRQCQHTIGAAYVTKFALQRRYPCVHRTWAVSDVELFDGSHLSEKMTTYYSSVELSKSDYVKQGKTFHLGIKPLRLIFVGTLEQLYKSPDVLIRAFAKNVQEGLDLELVMVGDGRYRKSLEDLVQKLGVKDKVIFTGMLPKGESVKEQLDHAHLFVLPSQAEGLPRAMLEAMARGLPCIGSTVGGIPELLPPEDMVPPGDVDALARKIREVVTNPQRMTEMSARNLQVSYEYAEPVLRARRVEFYKYIRRQTEAWLEKQRV